MSVHDCIIKSGLSPTEQAELFRDNPEMMAALEKGPEVKQEDLFGESLDNLNAAKVRAHIDAHREKVNEHILQTRAQIAGKRRVNNYVGKDVDAITSMNVYDTKSNNSGTVSVERASHVKIGDAHARSNQFMDSMETAKFSLFKGIFAGEADVSVEQKAKMRDVVKALNKEKVEDPDAADMGKKLGTVLEILHKEHREAGGKKGTLKGPYLPQINDPVKVRKVSEDDWFNYTYPKLDHETMLKDNPWIIDEGQLEYEVRKAYTSIVTDVSGKLISDPTQKIRLKASNEVAEVKGFNRFLKYKDADAWLDYQAKFGSSNVYASIVQHINMVARQTALMERYGPDYRAGYDFVKSYAILRGTDKNAFRYSDAYFRDIEGHGGGSPSAFVNNVASLKQGAVASKLGMAFLSSASDFGTGFTTRTFLGMSKKMGLVGYVKQYRSANRQFAVRLGLHAEYAISRTVSAFEEQNLQGHANMRNAADFVMRASGLSAHTVAARQNFGLELNSDLFRQITSGDLNPKLKSAMTRYGMDDKDIAKLKGAATVEFAGIKYYDPLAMDVDLRQKFQGMILEETDFAVNTPGVRERVQTALKLDPNTVAGAVISAKTQFMSFPLTTLNRHITRAMNIAETKGRIAYIGALVVSTTMMGALSIAAKDLVSGKEVTDEYMESRGFWLRALSQGGAIPIIGDLLLKEGGYQDLISDPITGGLLQDLMGVLVFGDIAKMSEGDFDNMNIPKDVVTVLKNNVPGTNLWYTRLAIERSIWDQARSMTDPNWRHKVQANERKMQRNEKRGYWSEPNR